MNKLNFVIEDCSKQMIDLRKKQLARGCATPHCSKDNFVDAIADIVCQRHVRGVRYQGKDRIKELAKEYMETKRAKFFNELED